MGTVAGAIDAHPQNLQSLITDFNTTAGAFARQNVALQQAVAELPNTLAAATPAFNALNAAFPPLRALARTLIPGVKSTGPTVDASLPFITQLRLLVQPSELEGLTHDLSPTIPALAHLTNSTIPLMKSGVRPASSCVANQIYPWSQLTAQRRAVQRLERLPASQGVRGGGRLSARPRGREPRVRRQRSVHPRARQRRHVDLLAPAGTVRPVADQDRRRPARPAARRPPPAARGERPVRDAARRSPTSPPR